MHVFECISYEYNANIESMYSNADAEMVRKFNHVIKYACIQLSKRLICIDNISHILDIHLFEYISYEYLF
jgi:hypothetical protein